MESIEMTRNNASYGGPEPPGELLWNIKTVIQKTGLSRATIYRYTQRNLVPAEAPHWPRPHRVARHGSGGLGRKPASARPITSSLSVASLVAVPPRYCEERATR
jgi:hypothetical protein